MATPRHVGLDGEPMDLFRTRSSQGGPTRWASDRYAGRRLVVDPTLGPAFEGPGRAHGGVVARRRRDHRVSCPSSASWPTPNLNLDYVAPAPLHQELRVTASLRDRADRKLWLQAHGESDDGIFVRAEALFLTVDLTKFANDDSTT